MLPPLNRVPLSFNYSQPLAFVSANFSLPWTSCFLPSAYRTIGNVVQADAAVGHILNGQQVGAAVVDALAPVPAPRPNHDAFPAEGAAMGMETVDAVASAVRAVAGTYENHEYDGGGKNDWHYATLLASEDGRSLTWSNRAGYSWGMTPSACAQSVPRSSRPCVELVVGTDSPYHTSDTEHAIFATQCGRLFQPRFICMSWFRFPRVFFHADLVNCWGCCAN